VQLNARLRAPGMLADGRALQVSGLENRRENVVQLGEIRMAIDRARDGAKTISLSSFDDLACGGAYTLRCNRRHAFRVGKSTGAGSEPVGRGPPAITAARSCQIDVLRITEELVIGRPK